MFETSAGVFSNLGASAIDQKQYPFATIAIGLAAVLTAAKSTTEYLLSEKDKKDAEDALLHLVEKYRGLRQAIEALASGEETHAVLSQPRAREFLSLLDEPQPAEETSVGQESLIVYIGRWIEEWAERHDEAWEEFTTSHTEFATEVRATLDNLGSDVRKGFAEQRSTTAQHTAELKSYLDSRLALICAPRSTMKLTGPELPETTQIRARDRTPRRVAT